MFATFLDKLSSLFDGRFLIAYWGPLFVALALCVGLWSIQINPAAAGAWWEGQSAAQQWLVSLGVLLSLTIFAFMLQALTTPLVRVYEGYWPRWLGGLQRQCIRAESARRKRLLEENNPRAAYYSYPWEERYVRATRLGNTMTAAEGYAYSLYAVDAIIWWPRLAVLLPAALRSQIDGAFTPVVALLNLCTLFLLWAVGGSTWLLWQSASPWLFALVFGGGLLLAWGCYRAAITQAEDYGDLLRAALDLHRRDLLVKLCLPLPDNLVEEQRLWRKLGRLHYYHTFPWVPTADPAPEPLPADPLYFDTHQPGPPVDPKPQQVQVTLHGAPPLVICREEGEHGSCDA